MSQLPNPLPGQVPTTPNNLGGSMWPAVAIEGLQALITIVDELIAAGAATTVQQQAVLEQQRKVLSDQIDALGT